MSAEATAPDTAAETAPSPKPKPRRFVRSFAASGLDPALVTRQMTVTTRAFQALGSAELARAFLNAEDDALGGRPIDVAGGSAEGLARVLDRIAADHPA